MLTVNSPIATSPASLDSSMGSSAGLVGEVAAERQGTRRRRARLYPR
jgi:hypothetical protein